MTGFGKGEALLPNKKITVEIRSLNSKQLDLNLRLPAIYRQSEYELRTLVGRCLVRGKVDVFVTVENRQVETPARIDRELFREYLRQAGDAMAHAGIGANYEALVPAILRMPEVVSTETEAISDEEHAALLAATESAAARLDAFRVQEGAILIADLLRRVDLIEQYRNEVVPYEPVRTENVGPAFWKPGQTERGSRPQPSGAGDDFLSGEVRHHGGEGAADQPLQLLPRSGRERGVRGPQAGIHRPGDGPRNQHHGLESQRSEHPDSGGEDEGRAGKDQGTGTQHFIKK